MTDGRIPSDTPPPADFAVLSKALAEKGFYVLGALYPGQKPDTVERLIASLKNRPERR